MALDGSVLWAGRGGGCLGAPCIGGQGWRLHRQLDSCSGCECAGMLRRTAAPHRLDHVSGQHVETHVSALAGLVR